jgi:hypothetical protein
VISSANRQTIFISVRRCFIESIGGFILKLAHILLFFAACALPAVCAPISYDITFTGGTGHGPFMPESGSFSYDPSNGFSNFLVLWDGAIFDLTSSANAPSCQPEPSCSTPAASFAALMNPSAIWTEATVYAGGPFSTTLSFEEFSDPQNFAAFGATVVPSLPEAVPYTPAVGTFTVTLATAPEPATVGLLGLGLLGAVAFRRRIV